VHAFVENAFAIKARLNTVQCRSRCLAMLFPGSDEEGMRLLLESHYRSVVLRASDCPGRYLVRRFQLAAAPRGG